MRRLTQEEVIKRFVALNPEDDYSKVVFVNIRTKVVIICPEHGAYKQTPHNRFHGQGCPTCGNESKSQKKILSQKDFEIKAKTVHGSVYKYGKYINGHRKIDISCLVCHKTFQQRPYAHLAGQGCPTCGNAKRTLSKTKTTKEYVKQAEAVHGKKYDYSKVCYTLGSNKIAILCKRCNLIFEQKADDHLQNHGCPKCSNCGPSKIEKSVCNWLTKEGINIELNNRTILEGKEIDILLPKHNIGIEINGLHWHKDKPKAYHQHKTLKAKEKGIQLIHLWENELLNKAPIVKSMLRVKLGMAKKRVYARDTEVKEIDSKEASEFLNLTHIQGSVYAKVCLGLFYKEKLVSVMTLDKPRFNKKYQWEILRLSSKLNTVVVGGASKLFSYFVKVYQPTSVISYADLDHGDGSVYSKLGFNYLTSTMPGYFWLKNKDVLPRYRTQKHKLLKLLGKQFDSNLSEKENMEKAGFSRVFNSGNAVYSWNTGAKQQC
jgi:very-short-patch-repair endonuclease